MNLAESAPQWLVALLVAVLAAAAIEDVVRLKISNWTQLAVLLAAGVAIAIAGPQWSLWENFLVLAALVALGVPLFAAGIAGGGDIKLLAATGSWFSLGGALWLIVAVLLAGGLVALLVMIIRLFGWSEDWRRRVILLRSGGGIPYGVAISVGAIIVISVQRG